MKLRRVLTNIFTYALLMCSVVTNVFATPTLSTEVTNSLTEIASILFLVGAAVCVGKCIHIGILYVMSSAVEKSTAKMAIVPWLVGSFVCFGGATLGKFIIELLDVNKSVLQY